MILVIDNYDSFTYNLVQELGELGAQMQVVRNDKTTLEAIEAARPERIIISPGPCTPNEAGISCEVVSHFAGKLPILGVCLGHQAIGQVFGGKVVRAPRLMHGKTSLIHHDGLGVYRGLENPFEATRYHSLTVTDVPDCLVKTSWTDEDELMGVRHRDYPIEGVQFHPESFLTGQGMKLLENFLKI